MLLTGLSDCWSPEWLTWEPKTVQLEIADDFGVQIHPDLFDKLMAARQIVTSDTAFVSLPGFIALINAINGDGIDTPFGKPIDPEDLCWGVLEQCILYPPGPPETYSPEIIGYMQECLAFHGVRSVPAALVPFLPPANFSEAAAADAYTIEVQFDRVKDINTSVALRLKKWYLQMQELRLSNGKLDEITKSIPKSIIE